MTHLAAALAARKDFVVTCELIPGRGHVGKNLESILKFAEGVKDLPYIHAVSLTDNAGGNPALSADVVGAEVRALGLDVIVHFSCKDMNRNFVESRAFALQRQGIGNLLVISGDYPISGFLGLSKPVFDMDSVTALHYLSAMNAGLPIPSPKGEVRLEKTELLLGAAVSPFKWREASSVMQYMKLEKKIRAGAQFIITQLGYDARKSLELIRYMRGTLASDLPVLGSVYVLSAGAAEVMSRGEVPGSYVSPDMVAMLREESKSADKGKQARLERAARQLALLKGLGYNGAHLEGIGLKAEDVRFIVERSVDLSASWESYFSEFAFAPPNPYYYFEKGEELRLPKPEQPAVRRKTARGRIGSPNFWVMRGIHHAFFIPKTVGYRMMAGMAGGTERHRGFAKALTSVEHVVKRTFFQCRSCDDCALFETYYLCPESRCPKGMRAGPCGGSREDEGCEVFADRPCLWRGVYWRAKNRKEVDTLSYMIPPRDWKLYETGSWANYFLKRDHSGHPLIPVPMVEKEKKFPNNLDKINREYVDSAIHISDIWRFVFTLDGR